MAYEYLLFNELEARLPGLEPASTTISAATLTGLLLGVDSNGDFVLADSGEGDDTAVEARGASYTDGTYGITDITKNKDRVDLVNHSRLYGFSGLTPGSNVYLSSGGAYTQTVPTKVGSLKQYVGFAYSATTVWVDIHPAETVA